MRFAYAVFAFLIWTMIMSQTQGVSLDAQCLSFAIVVAGAMAGGDGK